MITICTKAKTYTDNWGNLIKAIQLEHFGNKYNLKRKLILGTDIRKTGKREEERRQRKQETEGHTNTKHH